MDEEKTLFERFGAYLAVAAIAALMFLAARSLWVSEEVFSYDPPSDSSVEAVSAVPIESVNNLNNRIGEGGPSFDIDEVPILIDHSLSPNLYPQTYRGQTPHHEPITYTVQPNDTPIGIAEKFGIKPETILGGNAYLSEESSALQAGETLVILPIDGVLHDVGEGESLEDLANLYGVTVDVIIDYEPNHLEFPYRLYPGTQIMIPGGVREVFVWSAPSLPSRPATSDSTGSGISPLVQGTGSFIWPVGNRRITQHFWYGHGAIDIGSAEGSQVIASDTGTVTWAGWNVYGYGNLIVINHGNGYETYYAHLSNVGVVPGQVVTQGQYIGSSGNTGRSSGPHLHFEIRYFNSMLEPLSILR